MTQLKTRRNLSLVTSFLDARQNSAGSTKTQRKKPKGMRAFFYGQSSEEKKSTLQSLSNEYNLEVYRIDLSEVVSKYIGETEKNLKALFGELELKDSILFFDEADALFGKRTDIKDSHDKYANLEISYLLKQVENFPGLVIVSSNSKKDVDEKSLQKFQAVVNFPKPRPVRTNK